MKECRPYFFDDDGTIPNNPSLPLLVYPGVLESAEGDPGAVKRLLGRHKWKGAWVNGIYSYPHYHSTAHEVLVVTGGSAEVQFGGTQGEQMQLGAGDAVVIPAGVGHCRISSSPGFQVVGAYPEGQSWDLCTGRSGERSRILKNIRSVPLPERDPLSGEREPLLGYWE
ncbi:cupin domain-containing protein [Halalkalibaculum sp. DA384]|uniref:cupin domain-containing protein n=1 Tax=Halalkalibaculum sp. DA384 TaxID=3373606 RepID=UPI0037543320